MLSLKTLEEILVPPVIPPPVALWRRIRPQDYIYTLLPLGAFALWLYSLHLFKLPQMNDLGLISVMPSASIFALALISISFCLALRDDSVRAPVLLLHMVLLIFMLYGVTALVEDAPRFGTVYKHIGYTDYFVRNGRTDPGLTLYFSWPTFFILGALFTKVAGFQTAFGFVAWSPLFLNVLYFGPLVLIMRSLTTNRRVVWFAVWLFYLLNWIGQDYYSPQGMNIFLYLVIIAILLKWFKLAPKVAHSDIAPAGLEVYAPTEQSSMAGKNKKANRLVEGWRWGNGKIRWWLAASDTIITPSTLGQKIGLLAVLFGVFAFNVSSHPLTPYFVLASVTLLIFFRRIYPFWLLVPMWALALWWLFVMGSPFLAGHSNMVIGTFGLLNSAVALNVTDRVVGSTGHIFITKVCLVLSASVWLLAFLGGLRRLLHGYRDLTAILLALAPFPLLIAQAYGGEMLFRIYLVSLPFMAFFVAALFFEPAPRLSARWLTVALIVLNLLFLGMFLFARYGNERNDYISQSEVSAIRTLYRIAPQGSILIRGWEGGPWEFQQIENYDSHSLDDDPLTIDIAQNNYLGLVRYVKNHKAPAAYMVFMRSTQSSFATTSGLPPDRLQLVEHELLASGNCKLVFKNKDAEIIQFV